MGYFILMKCGYELEKYSSEFHFFETEKIDAILTRLEKNRIFIAKNENQFKKLLTNIFKGNFKYIWKRIVDKINPIQAKKLLNFSLRYKDSNEDVFFIRENDKNIGHAIFMDRKFYDANYIANSFNENISNEYIKFIKKNKKQPKLVTSGGFSNKSKQPEGLTVDNGNIVNAVLMPDRHGLVIVQPNGGIRIINLKRKGFTLPVGYNRLSKELSPLNNLIDYSFLVKWMHNNKATAFQTQLLAYSNEILINKKFAKNELRERRFLALVSDKKSNYPFHIILNIEKSVNMADATEKVFDILRQRNFKIEAIINLDVGTYNILEVFSKKGKVIVKAPVPLKNATNLLFYTKKQ
jgi:hypothetical protein